MTRAIVIVTGPPEEWAWWKLAEEATLKNRPILIVDGSTGGRVAGECFRRHFPDGELIVSTTAEGRRRLAEIALSPAPAFMNLPPRADDVHRPIFVLEFEKRVPP